MKQAQIKAVADEADMVVGGYAFTMGADGLIRVLNLAHPNHAVVLSPEHEVLETSMDDIEVGIVLGHLERNREFLVV